MKDKIEQVRSDIEQYVLDDPAKIDKYKSLFTGKKGVINELFAEFKALPGPEKAQFGKVLNELKQFALKKLKDYQDSASRVQRSTAPEDLSLPGDPSHLGSRHPISLTMNEILGIFQRVGFEVADGPEIEDDWHNFTALNLPDNHPAREMQDTFYIQKDPDYLLRTHTSNVQIRVMENSKPPIRILAPGRVFRNEAISARSHCFFHQVEGLYIDKGVSFADLRQILDYFAKQMFGPKAKTKFRPSFFPFTEMSAEMDVYWGLESEDDYRITKGTGWLEVLGCGMVDPAVLENCGIDPNEYSGYAFGIGVDRMAMLRYGINDIRTLSQNDLRFLEQFSSLHI